MGAELHNAASELGRRLFEDIMVNAERLGGLRDHLADDFLHEDRRRVVAFPDLGPDEFIETLRFGHGEGFAVGERRTIAVRGERLALAHLTTRFADGSVKEYLSLGQSDVSGTRVQRMVRFDLSDIDAAIAELDRLHAEAETGDS